MFECKICHKFFKCINRNHLKKHNITINQYRELFPESQLGYSLREKIKKKTCLKRYGVENISQVKGVKLKKKETCRNNYGVDYPAQSEVIKENYKLTCLEKYGVDNPAKSEVIKEKIKQIYLEKYGVDNPAKSEVVKEKKKVVLNKRYDSDYYSSSEVAKTRWLKKHKFLIKIEEIKIENNNFFVHCKNHLCPNSKEKGGWFTPTRGQLHDRKNQLEHPDGNDGSNFYCSQKCKVECPRSI